MLNHPYLKFFLLMQTVVGSSLALHTSLLMPLTSSIGPIVHLHGLTGLVKSHQ